jgi:DNA-binding MurR/RpiR family transcriptional regulator
MSDLAPAESRVARALLARYPIQGLEPLAQVAEQAGTSAPTVLRLVVKLGFAGYPDFQRELRQELSAHWPAPLETLPHEVGDGLVDRVRRAISTSVTEDLEHLGLGPDLPGAASLLADLRRQVWVCGGRFSRVLADYLASHLQVLRPGVHLVSGDPAQRHTALLDIERRSVVVAFDYRRYQHDTIEFARVAARQGAVVVLFTDHLMSPLASDATHVMTTTLESGSAFAVMTPAMAAVETLIVSVVEALGGAPRQRMERYDTLSTEVAGQPDLSDLTEVNP